MCGITADIIFNKKEVSQSSDILKMTRTLRHRGPDDEGYLFVNTKGIADCIGAESKINTKLDSFENKISSIEEYNETSYLALGHRRLSIIDLSTKGHQPLTYLDRYWIIFNGEIYNYIELREELKANGYSFNTDCDTEVILAAYDFWGAECLKLFNGMWAFILYDSLKEKLFISRDRFGIKPLSYYIDDERIIFASEIKALVNHSAVKTAPNIKYIKDFIKSFPKEYLSETAFENIFHFPVSHYLEIDLNNKNNKDLNFIRFWKIEVNNLSDDFDELKVEQSALEYRNLIEDAVRIRLRSDVPVGTSFSGGLDSSTIVYLIRKILNENNAIEKQKTFSLVFKNTISATNCDESLFIERMVDLLDLQSYTIEPTNKMVLEEYFKTVYAMDSPQEDALLSCMFTYKLVGNSDIKVTLDGQGADEIQGGYLRYLVNYFTYLPSGQIFKNYYCFNKIPGARKEIITGILFNIINKFRLSNVTLRILRIFGFFSNPFLKVNERLYNDFTENLVNLLHFGDRSSMAYSIESRFPFLDHRMVDFWFKLPIKYKINLGWTKYLARKSFYNLLPDEITWRKDKMGWETPQMDWFNNVLNKVVRDRLFNSFFIKDLNLDIDLHKLFIKMKRDPKALKLIIKLFNISLWHAIFFRNEKNL